VDGFHSTSATDAIIHGHAESELHFVASSLCMAGVFLLILLSEPLLNALGFDYSGKTGGALYQKIHPGTYVIVISLVVFLWDRDDPIRQYLQTLRQHTIFALALLIHLLLLLYWLAKSPEGVGVLIDTHMTAIICAVVLSYAPQSCCRIIVYGFLALALVNSLTGIMESIFRFRIFTFDADWVVLREEYFRASAFLGHPLNNALFTTIALFVAMSLRISGFLKMFLLLIFLTSLVAFGGRAGFVFSVLGLIPLAIQMIRSVLTDPRLTQSRRFLFMTGILIVPVLLFGGLFLVMGSPIGERLMALSSFTDASAQGRWLAFKAVQFMTTEEIWFGATAERVVEIAYRMSLVFPITDIENPWVMMFMLLGLLAFSVWLVTTLVFAWRLMRGQLLALQLAVLGYFVVASSFNSFGTKNTIYAILVAVVISAQRAFVISDNK